jgi:hypothetical protein
MCAMPYHRYCPEDPEHEWSPTACINALRDRIAEVLYLGEDEMTEGELDRVSKRCACRQVCGDVAECDDSSLAVCKGLRRAPEPPLVEIMVVHRG